SYSICADGEPTPYVYLNSGGLPGGVNFFDDYGCGSLEGTPNGSASVNYFQLAASNSYGIESGGAHYDYQDFTLYIDELPQITSGDNTEFTAGSYGEFYAS